MTRRRIALACAAAAFVLLVLPAAVATLRRPAPARRLNTSAFADVRAGMTEAEVEALLGAPAGDYGRAGLLDPFARRLGKDQKAWCDDEQVLFVTFDGAGAVAAAERRDWNLDPSTRGFRGFLRRLRLRLGL
jgi:hypothetical protein